jgi:hypothetical protein
MKNNSIKEENYFSLSFVLTRVLNTGVIMSIEKNESELRGLEKTLKKLTNKKYVVLFNSFTAAIHGALTGQDIVYGSTASLTEVSERELKFLNWLGVEIRQTNETKFAYEMISINPENIGEIESLIEDKEKNSSVLVIDLTDLGFGPCSAIVTNEEIIRKKAERLKIFGAFDLNTMWTQEESELDIQPGIQFNYRLSPLVAACVKLSLLRRNKFSENRLHKQQVIGNTL